MNYGILQKMAVKDHSARAFHEDAARLPRLPFIRRKLLAGVPECVFSRGPIALSAPRLKIGGGSLREKRRPRLFKISAGFRKCWRGSVGMLARMTAGIKTAVPLPRVRIVGVSSSDRYRPGVHVAVIDMPAFVAGVWGAAAGEFGHDALKRNRNG
jgi:hypothetical protein